MPLPDPVHPPPLQAAPAAPDSRPRAADALQAATALLRQRLLRAALFMLVLCSAIAVFLAGTFGHALGPSLVYSFCIGLSCWALTDGCRLALAWWVDRRRALQGLAPLAHGFAIGWPGMIGLMLLGVLAGPMLGLALGDALTGRQSPPLLALERFDARVTLGMTVVGTGLALFAFSTFERLASARAQAEAARRAAAEHQLMLLQSQLEPHMLFNTLANLRVLIALDAPRAQAMLDRLIAYLRATLSASRSPAHALADEFARLQDYLALMAIRMGPRLQVSFDLPAALRNVPVPPLLLQPLVENSIRHGLEPKVDGGALHVAARREGNALVLEVRDGGVGLAEGTRRDGDPALGTHFGLHQVRSRLATLHGDHASLDLLANPEGPGTLARIRMPWPGPGAAMPPRPATT
jgi:hypothetical protein